MLCVLLGLNVMKINSGMGTFVVLRLAGLFAFIGVVLFVRLGFALIGALLGICLGCLVCVEFCFGSCVGGLLCLGFEGYVLCRSYV